MKEDQDMFETKKNLAFCTTRQDSWLACNHDVAVETTPQYKLIWVSGILSRGLSETDSERLILLV